MYFLVECHELIAEQVESTRVGEKMYCFRGKMLTRTSNACNFSFCLGANITHEWTFHHGLPGGSEMFSRKGGSEKNISFINGLTLC